MNKIKRFLNNIDSKALITLAAMIFTAVGIWVIYAAISQIDHSMDLLRTEKARQLDEHVGAIKKLKAECTLVRTNLGNTLNTYTYACDDGVEYTFEEWK